MCGIAGIVDLHARARPDLGRDLQVMNDIQAHRGPDDEGIFTHRKGHVGLAHRRLSIIDLATGHQPMTDDGGNTVCHNGEIYNYVELRRELASSWTFRTTSDTEVILAAYRRWKTDCVNRFRGMFAFALWDEEAERLFCARDHFGIKPFYYHQSADAFYFASEAKALLPFTDRIETDLDAFKEYLTFQLCLGGKTLFQGIRELEPAHTLTVQHGRIASRRYWEVHYEPDFDHTERHFETKLRRLVEESVALHLRADIPVGAYISGGVDSSVLAALAADRPTAGPLMGFTGKFSEDGEVFDESRYARGLAQWKRIDLREADITADDFIQNIRSVIYHLDYPAAGPGSFPQFMVSRLAAGHRKVVLGGQGGDEIFGGYTRYLLAYFEQCIRGAIEGTMHQGNFIVTYESIIPNLVALKNYKPLIRHFWQDGLFEPMDRRYFRLVNRAPGLGDAIHWDALEGYSARETFQKIFRGDNVSQASYFDLMTHFDFKTLLPALLHVEDRMSMAHGLESRVPLLDRPIVELAATIPSNIKFRNGSMKHIFRQALGEYLTPEIRDRTDKMGFPTPFAEWLKGEVGTFVRDVLSTTRARNRELVDNRKVVQNLEKEPSFGREIWGLLCLELWQQEFHDQRDAIVRHRKTRSNHESTHHRRRRIYRLPSDRPVAGRGSSRAGDRQLHHGPA